MIYEQWQLKRHDMIDVNVYSVINISIKIINETNENTITVKN